MKARYLLVLSTLVLTGCQITRPVDGSTPSGDSTSIFISTSEQGSPSSQGGTSSINPTSATPITVSPTSATPTATQTQTTTSAQSTTTTTPVAGKLPCGWDYLESPDNTPIVLETSLSDATAYEYPFTDEFPSNDWGYIYGNNLTSAKFYTYNSSNPSDYPGGIKLDQKGKGFQTPKFSHEGAKLEVRIALSQCNKAGGGADQSRSNDIASLYAFDASGNLLTDSSKVWTASEFANYLVDGNKNQKEVKVYLTGSNTSKIAYLEFRIHALPYKGSQAFNIGIKQLTLKSWERV